MRGKNYSPEGVKHLLKIVNTILPISDTELERFTELYNEKFQDEQGLKTSLQRKFSEISQSNKAAKYICERIISISGISCGDTDKSASSSEDEEYFFKMLNLFKDNSLFFQILMLKIYVSYFNQ